jgi:hypothetical protein
MLTRNRFGTLGWRLASLAALLGALGLLLADSADDDACPSSAPIAGTYDAVTTCGGGHAGRLTLVDTASPRQPEVTLVSGDLDLRSVLRSCGAKKVDFTLALSGQANLVTCTVDLASDLGQPVACGTVGCTLQLTVVPIPDQGVH